MWRTAECAWHARTLCADDGWRGGSDAVLPAVLPLELVGKVVHKAVVVEVLTAKVCVASSGLHLKHTLLNGQQRHIKGASAKVEDHDVGFPALLV